MCMSLRIPVVLLLLMMVTSVQAQPPGRQRGRGSSGRGGPTSLLALLVSMEKVQQELEIVTAQEKLLEALLDDLRQQQRGAFARGFSGRRGDGEARGQETRRRMQELNEQGEELLATILEPEQWARFNQLRIQYEGVRALDRDEVTKVLGLTDTQQQLIREFRESNSPSEGSRQRQLERSGQRREADIMAVFTEEQKKKWDEMKGEAFVFPQRPRSFGRWGFQGPGRDGERQRPQRPPSDR